MRKGSARPGGRRPEKLDVESVVDAAFAVLDEHGLEALTVRRIADRLGVANPALYWHFENKQKIVDAMAARMIARATVAPRHRETWDRFVTRWAKSFRAEMRLHRDGARVVAAADLGPSAMGGALETALAFLVDAGFTPRDAAVGIVTITDYTLGATFEEQADPVSSFPRAPPLSPPTSPLVRALARLDGEGVFEAGVALLVGGLRGKLAG